MYLKYIAFTFPLILSTIFLVYPLPSSTNLQSTQNHSPQSFFSYHKGYSAQTGPPQDSSQIALAFYISLLSNAYYYGAWTGYMGISSDFDNTEGYCYVDHQTSEDYDTELTIYNGNYTDDGFVLLLFSLNSAFPVVNVTNATVTASNIEIIYQIGKPFRRLSNRSSMLVNFTVYFVDIKTGKPLLAPQDNPSGVNSDRVGIQFNITGDAGIIASTSLMVDEDPLVSSQGLPYCLVSATLATIQSLACIILLSDLKRDEKQGKFLSVWVLLFVNAFSFYEVIIHAAIFLYPLRVYALVALVYFLLSLNMQRLTWRILEIQVTRLDQTVQTRAICKMYLWIYVFIIIPSVLCFMVYMDLIYYCASFCLVPQIIYNFKNLRRGRFNFWIVFGLIFPTLLFTCYTKIDPDNMIRSTPNISAAVIYLSFVFIQMIILWIQTEWPGLGFHRKFPYYYFKSKDVKSSQTICAICLERLKGSMIVASGGTNAPLISTPKAYTYMVLTPCKHEFHELCLRQWMETKQECPYCRQGLPPLLEE